ncbi:MAG: hypothetical protein NZ901_07705 [Geminocystis sp.]|nr:hypothetical protein [Geminocystis sp.]HIK36831.1 hypothetical protein [Geminocystis sp. M7585_C2015_104]MCS7148057.1 hypothetical protein [Geminocystis sp.]MCX8077801.1 hypothetical protein [Geminocystis sp.]MDW8116409.1 hypothetical protein [Geminocystis sp.]
MNTLEEVKAKIREGKIDEAKAIAFASLLRIEIETSCDADAKSSSCHSVIDILENEIEHHLGDESLTELHFKEVEKAQQYLIKNSKTFRDLLLIIEESNQDF